MMHGQKNIKFQDIGPESWRITSQRWCWAQHFKRHIIQTDIIWNDAHVISNATQIYRY